MRGAAFAVSEAKGGEVWALSKRKRHALALCSLSLLTTCRTLSEGRLPLAGEAQRRCRRSWNERRLPAALQLPFSDAFQEMGRAQAQEGLSVVLSPSCSSVPADFRPISAEEPSPRTTVSASPNAANSEHGNSERESRGGNSAGAVQCSAIVPKSASSVFRCVLLLVAGVPPLSEAWMNEEARRLCLDPSDTERCLGREPQAKTHSLENSSSPSDHDCDSRIPPLQAVAPEGIRERANGERHGVREIWGTTTFRKQYRLQGCPESLSGATATDSVSDQNLHGTWLTAVN